MNLIDIDYDELARAVVGLVAERDPDCASIDCAPLSSYLEDYFSGRLATRRRKLPFLRSKTIDEVEEKRNIERRVMDLMDLVVAEWTSDPTSVSCFDLRIVNEAKKITKRYTELEESTL